jgi:hypothetical protein
MKFVKPLLASAAVLAWAGAAAAATYLPVGPKTNVAMSTVTGGGWHQCYSDTYFGALPSGPSISSILSACDGAHLMLAVVDNYTNGPSDTLLLLAQALRADVTFDTGDNNATGTTHLANGSEWYFSNGIGAKVTGAWGFAGAGQAVKLNTCDVNDTGRFGGTALNLIGGATRLCWQTDESLLTGGWRAGNNFFLTDSVRAPKFQRIVFTDAKPDAAVPEPASWAMMIAGFGLVGGAMRRRTRMLA